VGPGLVLRNPKNGTFGFVAWATTPVLGAAADATRAVAARDLDGDGRVDIVLANNGRNRVFMNAGNGTFTALPTLGNNDGRDVVAVDLAGDPALELVFANANRTPTVYSYNRALNRFDVATVTLPAGTSIAAGDFDGNGRIDLVIGGLQSKAVAFNATPPGGALQFSAPTGLGVSPTADILATDTDADGDVDIVGINSSGGHQIYANNGVGAFTPRAQQFASVGPRHATAAKLSVDDRIDVAVIGASTLEVFYNDGAGNLGKGDTGAPVIQLTGQASVELTVESAYTDAGATASDTVDGDLTTRIKIDNPVNTAVVGTYTVTYNVVDNSGNAAAPVTRTVRVGVRSGTGGGGGGAIDFVALLMLAALALLNAVRPWPTRRSAS
jgi:hypothetical protein